MCRLPVLPSDSITDTAPHTRPAGPVTKSVGPAFDSAILQGEFVEPRTVPLIVAQNRAGSAGGGGRNLILVSYEPCLPPAPSANAGPAWRIASVTRGILTAVSLCVGEKNYARRYPKNYLVLGLRLQLTAWPDNCAT